MDVLILGLLAVVVSLSLMALYPAPDPLGRRQGAPGQRALNRVRPPRLDGGPPVRVPDTLPADTVGFPRPGAAHRAERWDEESGTTDGPR